MGAMIASAGRRTFVTSHPAGACAALHRHEASYVALVLEGGYEEYSVDGVWRCEPGDLVVHPPMHLHMNRFSARRTRVLNVVLDPRPFIDPGSSYGVWRPRKQFSLRSLSDMDLAAIDDVLAQSERSPALARIPGLSNMAGALAFDSRRGIGAEAGRLGMTREHVSRRFQREFGMPASVFRSEFRFRRALAMVTALSMPLVSVALEAGYADQAHLTRDFKSRTGVTPAALRRRLRTEREITSVQS